MFDCFVIIGGIFMAVIMNFVLIFFGKFKEYITIEKQKRNNIFIKFFDVLWRPLVPLIFVFVGVGVPIEILSSFIVDENNLKKITSIYVYAFFISYLFFIFCFIKLGIIKKEWWNMK